MGRGNDETRMTNDDSEGVFWGVSMCGKRRCRVGGAISPLDETVEIAQGDRGEAGHADGFGAAPQVP